MLDKIMNLLGYENINKILIPEAFKKPRIEKIRCKAKFYSSTGYFQDKIIINQKRILLDGYVTYCICKWTSRKYVRVLKVNIGFKEYKNEYKFYDTKVKAKGER